MVLSDKFSASRFWDDIKKYRATQFNYLGAVIPILEKQPEKPDDIDNTIKVAFGAGCPAGGHGPLREEVRPDLYGGVRHERDRHPRPCDALRQEARVVRKVPAIYDVRLFDDEDKRCRLMCRASSFSGPESALHDDARILQHAGQDPGNLQEPLVPHG